MSWLSLFGLDRRIRRLRIAAGEGALAAEDRAQLVRMAWDDEKLRLRRILALALAVVGLTTVVVALLSVAVVVHFWETPHRIAAAWSVAIVWLVLWLAAVLGLVSTMRASANGFDAARREFGRDWLWLRGRIGSTSHGTRAPRQAPAATREELLARIERQRERIAMLEADAAAPVRGASKAPPPDETPTEAALRLARSNPVATGAVVAGAVAVLGPKRIVRWTAWLLPVLWRMR